MKHKVQVWLKMQQTGPMRWTKMNKFHLVAPWTSPSSSPCRHQHSVFPYQMELVYLLYWIPQLSERKSKRATIWRRRIRSASRNLQNNVDYYLIDILKSFGICKLNVKIWKVILLGLVGRTEKSQNTVSTLSVPIIRYNPLATCPKYRNSAQDFGIAVAATRVLPSLLSSAPPGWMDNWERGEFAGRLSICCRRAAISSSCF